MPVPQAFQAEKPPFELPSSGAAKLLRRVATAIALAAALGGAWVEAAPPPVAFHATAGTRRAEFGMVRDLADELGGSTSVDVTLEIDVEALAAPAAP